jgi:hypothetical protein
MRQLLVDFAFCFPFLGKFCEEPKNKPHEWPSHRVYVTEERGKPRKGENRGKGNTEERGTPRKGEHRGKGKQTTAEGE